MMQEIVTVYADKGYDAAYIRNYLRYHGIRCCIPYKSNSKSVLQNKLQDNSEKRTSVAWSVATYELLAWWRSS